MVFKHNLNDGALYLMDIIIYFSILHSNISAFKGLKTDPPIYRNAKCSSFTAKKFGR